MLGIALNTLLTFSCFIITISYKLGALLPLLADEKIEVSKLGLTWGDPACEN